MACRERGTRRQVQKIKMERKTKPPKDKTHPQKEDKKWKKTKRYI